MNSKDIEVSLQGFVVKEPTLYETEGKIAFTTFRLGHSYSRFDSEKKEWIDDSREWFQVKTFGTLAKNTKESLKKGDCIIVHGLLKNEEYKDDKGDVHSSLNLIANTIGHNLRFGTTDFKTTNRVSVELEEKSGIEKLKESSTTEIDEVAMNLEGEVEDTNYVKTSSKKSKAIA